MGAFSIDFDYSGMTWSKRIQRLLNQSLDLESVWADAAEYMRRSTVNRFRTKKSPSGEAWEPLSEFTISLKGNSRILVDSGDLRSGIEVTDVTHDGFVLSADADYANYMQEGVSVVRGKYRSKRPAPQIPPRPFMGFSEENMRRIARLISKHLSE